MLASSHNIPKHTDTGKSHEYHTGIVHANGRNRDCGWHTEQNDCKRDPKDGDDIDDKSKLAEREAGVSNCATTADERNKNGDAVGDRETDCGNTSKGIEGRG